MRNQPITPFLPNPRKLLDDLIACGEVINAEVIIDCGSSIATCHCGCHQFYQSVTNIATRFCADCRVRYVEGVDEPFWDPVDPYDESLNPVKRPCQSIGEPE